MKKNILFLLVICIVASCATKTKKPEQRSKLLKGFSTYYNTLFNAKDALNNEFTNRDKEHKDNFYAPYISILTFEEQPLGSDLGQSAAFAENSMKMAEVANKPTGRGNSGVPNIPGVPGLNNNGQGTQDGDQGATKGATTLEIAEAKAMKAINKYSVTRNGEEKNKQIFDAYIILAQSRIYQNKPLQALDALNYVFTHMKDDKRVPLARIYQGVAYDKIKDYHRAHETFAKLKGENINKSYAKLLSIYYSESLLDAGKKEEAAKELDAAFELNSDRKLKSRIAYLRGQVAENLGQNDKARESYTAAYKYANDFEFEVKSQIAIAKTFNGKGDYNGAKNYLEGISKKGTYASRKNEFYYALGLMANKAGKKDEAQDFFRKSLFEKVSDPQIRGLAYYEIGKSYLDKNDYIGAGTYYDSALAVMTYEPSKILLKDQSEYIKKISKNYYLIKKNDSILSLAKMNDSQRTDFFAKYITKLKAKEEKEELERRRAERSKGFDTGDYNANSLFAKSGNAFEDFGITTKGFYFGNTGTVSKGTSTFKQVWGERALSDNWRYSKKMATIEDMKNEALGVTSAPNPRRFEPAYYIEQIPTDQGKLSQLKKDRDTASLGLGIMYQNYFTNTPLATKTLYDLVDVRPEEKVMLQALYEIFAMNYEKNPQASDRAKQILLADYPYTSYAEFARNPKNKSFVKSTVEVENEYKRAYALYESEKFGESKQVIDETLQKYPKDALVPKLNLLNAFNVGKSSGKEVMILQLEQIALNYSKTPEGARAKEMLNYLKSDLSFQATDNKGNAIPQQPGMPAQPNQYQQGNNNGSQMNNNVPQQPGPQTNMQVAELDPQQTQNNNQQKQKPKKPNNSNAPAKPQ
ncbi:tetratricopeptide repeat protein [Chryseobacterium indologenes]|uniref:Tetratricopeptide repeat protein n=1 Tax=Chryseobacterium indologenes TaxID=253 RepID=A0A4U8VMN8_CHRID|nr:tetratricopeptide repeat protein [Chryseobacterium indologenes]ASE63263.1 tetratricopeptide repeat protein [Chryseobacterium indologenes]AZB18972.1 tetratricopeptide repeat protein [Chryseobacterium indologenes]QPQ53159.1 tetratricopeptide repeat protein [Chryseobacterium indologenes]TLX27476.1 tetratricopeptide repeat protein [Chryseobacterium indologenes]SFJ68549.1 protein involved in gliding motility SprE [Chryseobacterium indologenes]